MICDPEFVTNVESDNGDSFLKSRNFSSVFSFYSAESKSYKVVKTLHVLEQEGSSKVLVIAHLN